MRGFTTFGEIWIQNPENKDPYDGYYSTIGIYKNKHWRCKFCNTRQRIYITDTVGPFNFNINWGEHDQEEEILMCDCAGAKNIGLTTKEIEDIELAYHYNIEERPKDWFLKSGRDKWKKSKFYFWAC